MTVRTALSGPFPRSEALVAATRDLDRGRTTPEAVEELFARTEKEVLDLETRLGLDAFTAGYLRWQDTFRPISESWSGFSVGPVTRMFETNTFFRQPILLGPPERTPGAIAARLPLPLRSGEKARAKIVLPGPYTLAGVLDNRSGDTTEGLIHRLGRLLGDELRELRGLGYSIFQFQEPLLVVDPPTGPRAESVLAAYRAIAAHSAGATTIVWTYFADAVPAHALLDRLSVSAIGVDLAETDYEHLGPWSGAKALGLGVIDPRTTLPEDPTEVARIVRELQDRLKPPAIWLGPGGPLDLLPAEAATRKLHLLPAARRALAADGGPR
jgi:5-methyltetrahydropteroyltriglutamate--homocysteine methyltransferase